METTIQATRLGKAYHGIPALKDVDITVGRGEIFGLLGANGAGKSTAVECILGARRPDTGTVSILGMDPRRDHRRLFERVGVQFQETHYQEQLTVAELCRLTSSYYRKPQDYLPLLEQFGLAGKTRSPVGVLSGGQKQRLFIALALIPRPEVVFLDELTTGLDVKARRDVWKCLSLYKKSGLTILMTSHFMDEVETLCDRIAILEKGSVSFCGTTSQAVASGPFEKLEDAYLWYSGEEREDESI